MQGRATPALALGLIVAVALAATSALGQDGPLGFGVRAPGLPRRGPRPTPLERAHSRRRPGHSSSHDPRKNPHVAGTAADYKTAVDVRDKLKSWGWSAELAEYEVLLNYPPRKQVSCSSSSARIPSS